MSKKELTRVNAMSRFICLMVMLPSLVWAGDFVVLEGSGGYDTAWAVNESGVIVGTSFFDDIGVAFPVRWTNEVLDVLDGPIVLADGTECDLEWGDARNVTNSGEVIARLWSWCDGLDIYRAASWDDDSRTWQPFPMPPGATWTYTVIANAAGHALVNFDAGWVLYKGSTITPVDIPSGCAPFAMNTKRMIGGYCGEDAALWYQGNQTILPSLGGNYSYVRGLSENGTMVGFSGEDLGSSLPGKAVSWNKKGAIQTVNDPGWATGINNRGAIVGAVGINGSDVDPLTPVWWDQHGNGPMYLAPGYQGTARSINNSGTIVGNVFIDDNDVAFVYYP